MSCAFCSAIECECYKSSGGKWALFGLAALGRLLDHLALAKVLSEDGVQVPADENEQHLLEFGSLYSN